MTRFICKYIYKHVDATDIEYLNNDMDPKHALMPEYTVMGCFVVNFSFLLPYGLLSQE